MKSISQHLGAIIVVLAGVALLVCSLTVWRAPIGDFFQNVAEKETVAGDNILSGIESLDLTPSLGGGSGSGDEELVISGVVPEGGVYYSAATSTVLTAGDTFSLYGENDMFVYGDYVYRTAGSQWAVCVLSTTIATALQNNFGLPLDGEGVDVTQQTAFDPILTSVNEQPVVSMLEAFIDCSAMTEAPAIPSSIISMEAAFKNCSSLTTAPEIPSSVTNMCEAFEGCSALTAAPTTIPSSVTNMESTFSGCTLLETAPTIPSSVTNLRRTFSNCTSLTGTVIINVETLQYNLSPFQMVDFQAQKLTLAGSYSNLDQLGSQTSLNYCENCNGYCTCGNYAA